MLDTSIHSTDIDSQEQELREYFGTTIPRLLELIEKEGITHVLLLEKTSRIFKEPLIQLFRQQKLDIKVGSFAPDYFPVDPNYKPTYSGRIKNEDTMKTVGRRQYELKLRFLPEVNEEEYQILILDEFVQNGTTIEKTVSGLQKLGYPWDKIHSCVFDGEVQETIGDSFTILLADGTIDRLISNFSRFPYSKFGKRGVFESDNYRGNMYYASLNKKTPERFREVISLLTKIILESTKN